MMLRSQLVLGAEPDFKFKAKSGPIAFKIGAVGSLTIGTSQIRARFHEIPIAITIPFLRRRHNSVIAASIGPFDLHLDPIEVSVRASDVNLDGVLGTDGMECDLVAAGSCKMEVDLTGKLPAKMVKAAVEGVIEE